MGLAMARVLVLILVDGSVIFISSGTFRLGVQWGRGATKGAEGGEGRRALRGGCTCSSSPASRGAPFLASLGGLACGGSGFMKE